MSVVAKHGEETMTQKELKDLYEYLGREVTARKSLGGYSVEANALLMLSETNRRIVGHLLQEAKAKAKAAKGK